MTFTHRIKSFLIAFGSIAGSALVVLLASPEFTNSLGDFQTYLKALGVPSSLVILLGLFVSEGVRFFLNKNQAGKLGASASQGVELY